ncbi:MAG: NADPH-dependent glutamate synthase [Actinobacteria bacterium]|nr:NADPH-dependent glutamate synthase [Actinomycetota bacterium]
MNQSSSKGRKKFNPRQKDKSISINERISTFKEVPLGFTPEQAILEAERCLQCSRPRCVDGCPVMVPIKDFISLVKEGKFIEASLKIKEKNALPAVCGRVCPQEDQCEKACVLGKVAEPVAIGKLERFVADYEAVQGTKEEIKPPERLPYKVAVIGSGPAGLTCAAELAKSGVEVYIYEALHEPGGVLTYGIPEFRLPKNIVKREIDYIISLGVKILTNQAVGANISLNEIIRNYDAVFIGVGAGLPRMLNIEGENLNGVYTANEYLTRINLMKAYLFPEYDTPIKRGSEIVVIGGGNVALDAARTALRTGAKKVTLAYRRTESEMPARKEEIEHAKEEGIVFEFLVSPIRFIGKNNTLRAVEFQVMELSEPDESGRRKPVPVIGKTKLINADIAITAIGTVANPLITKNFKKLKTNSRGYIEVDDNMMTSLKGVFAGGDIVTGAATVILAMGAGKKAAQSILAYLKNK